LRKIPSHLHEHCVCCNNKGEFYVIIEMQEEWGKQEYELLVCPDCAYAMQNASMGHLN